MRKGQKEITVEQLCISFENVPALVKSLREAPKNVRKQYNNFVIDLSDRLTLYARVLQGELNDGLHEDGAFLNLVAGHIRWYRKQLARLNKQYGLPLPAEFYGPQLTFVDGAYVAHGTCTHNNAVAV